MLTWQNNVPRFVAKGFVGDKMTFFFGSTNVDDIEISEFYFEIQLIEHDGTWSLYTALHQCNEQSRKPSVEACVSKLNQALRMHKDFDFRKYWRNWSHADKYFAVVIRNTLGGYRRVI